MSDTAAPPAGHPATHPKAPRQKVPAFARYEGTSAWRKDRRRVRAYEKFKQAAKQAEQHKATPAD